MSATDRPARAKSPPRWLRRTLPFRGQIILPGREPLPHPPRRQIRERERPAMEAHDAQQ